MSNCISHQPSVSQFFLVFFCLSGLWLAKILSVFLSLRSPDSSGKWKTLLLRIGGGVWCYGWPGAQDFLLPVLSMKEAPHPKYWLGERGWSDSDLAEPPSVRSLKGRGLLVAHQWALDCGRHKKPQEEVSGVDPGEDRGRCWGMKQTVVTVTRQTPSNGISSSLNRSKQHHY